MRKSKQSEKEKDATYFMKLESLCLISQRNMKKGERQV